uniref:Uncharacterized protein n=1 Tax=Aegilops tauschii TaxID=37682 RepID=N1QW77_AEGTA
MAVLDQETWVAVDVPEEFQVIVLSLPSTEVLVNDVEMPSTVTEVSMVDEYQNSFRVKVAKNIGLDEDLNKLEHAIFLNNITINVRIWKALTCKTHMNDNFTLIKSLLAPTNLGEDVCGICVKQDGVCLASFAETSGNYWARMLLNL